MSTVGLAEREGGTSHSQPREQGRTHRSARGLPTAHFPGRLGAGSSDRRGARSQEIHQVNTRPDKGQLRPPAALVKGPTSPCGSRHDPGTEAFPRAPLPWSTSGHGNVGALPGCGPASVAGGPRRSGFGGAGGGRPWATFTHCNFRICISSSISNSINLGVRRPRPH